MEQRYLLIASHDGATPIERIAIVNKAMQIIRESGFGHINTSIVVSDPICLPMGDIIMNDIGDSLIVSKNIKATFTKSEPNFINEIVNHSYRTPVAIAISHHPIKNILKDMNIEVDDDLHIAFCDLEKGCILEHTLFLMPQMLA